jgi:hypothetical protein
MSSNFTLGKFCSTKLSKYLWKEQTFFSDGAFVCTCKMQVRKLFGYTLKIKAELLQPANR